VKTARKPFNLLREAGKSHAEILVLASFDDSTGKATLIGWEWDKEMLKCPTRDFGYGIVNHYKHYESLRSMESLKEILGVFLGEFS
jgi:formylmethanofuran dehydrogenase subunit E-like metal-binding protein